MINLFGWKMFVLIDTPFKKLFDVIPQSLDRKSTREYLKKFIYRELPESEGINTDIFKRQDLMPTNEFVAIYGSNGKAAIGSIYIEYTSKAGKVAVPHAKTLSRQIDKYLKKEKYEYKLLEGNMYYWIKNNIIVHKQIKISRYNAFPQIDIFIRNANIYSLDKINEELIKEHTAN